MKKFAKLFIAIIISIFSFNILTTTPTLAESNICDNPNISDELKSSSGCSNAGETDNLPNVIQNILNAIILVSGIIAVVFIVIGGLHYMTSTGDAAKIKKARDTILYAAIGLIICVLAFAIINFVIINLIGDN